MKNKCGKQNMVPSPHWFFSATGGMGTITTVVYRRLASLLAEKQGRPYSSTLYWLRCRLNFSLLRSAIMCIQGSRNQRPTLIGLGARLVHT